MSVYAFAFVEYWTSDGWALAHPLVPDPDTPEQSLVPLNIAPAWSWDSLVKYAAITGDRELPADISPELSGYFNKFHKDEAYHISFATLSEVRQLIGDPQYQTIDHFNPDWLHTAYTSNPKHIRVIFWHD